MTIDENTKKLVKDVFELREIINRLNMQNVASSMEKQIEQYMEIKLARANLEMAKKILNNHLKGVYEKVYCTTSTIL